MQCSGLVGLLLTASCLLLLQGRAAASYYDDLLVENLYKRLAALQDDYLLDNNIPLDSRDSGQADIRDQEYLQHSSSKGGFQYISGGAGEGQQHLTPEGNQSNTQEVKSDDALPFYCHPPNPCPKGYNAEEHGCQETTLDSADAQKQWIDDMMARGMCACDEEHMFNCPKDTNTINTQEAQNSRDALDQIISNSFLGNENIYAQGSKRLSVVAKKSPGMVKRSVEVAAEDMGNGYSKRNEQDKLHVVAKKGIGY